MKRSRPSSEGFTRADLATLLATFSCLVLLVPPLLGNGRQHGQAAACLDNLRRLSLGWLMYAEDNQGWFPPNFGDGNTVPGKAWVAGSAGVGGAQEFDVAILADVKRSMVVTYAGGDVSVFRCPSDPRRGVLRPVGGSPVPDSPAARSISANGAVGTDPYVNGGKAKVDGPWLDNSHGHEADSPWRTYGRVDQIVAPSPSGLFLLIDEDEYSLNDGNFGLGMVRAEWIDWPGTRHDTGSTISFADGHTELHRWTDPRTVVINGRVTRMLVPGSDDYAWLRERTSARVP